MAWMTSEAAVAITTVIIASSIALIAFGLGSVIEFAAAVMVVWQLRRVPRLPAHAASLLAQIRCPLGSRDRNAGLASSQG